MTQVAKDKTNLLKITKCAGASHLGWNFMIKFLFVGVLWSLVSPLSLEAKSLTDIELEAAEISRLAYSKEDESNENFEFVDKLEVKGFRAVVYDRMNPIKGTVNRYIGFRGSKVYDNYKFVFHALIYKRSYKDHVQKLKDTGLYEPLIQLSQFVKKYSKSGKKTMLTGHSLGGFLTQIFSAYYHVSGIGFDDPRMFDYTGFQKDFHKRRKEFEKSKKVFYRSITLYGDKVPWWFGGYYLTSKHPNSEARYVFDGIKYSKVSVLKGHSLNHLASVLEKLGDMKKKFKNITRRFNNQEVVLKSHDDLYISNIKSQIFSLTDSFKESERFYLERASEESFIYFRNAKGHYLSCNAWGDLTQSRYKGFSERFNILEEMDDQSNIVVTCSNMFGLQTDLTHTLSAKFYNESWTLWEFVKTIFD